MTRKTLELEDYELSHVLKFLDNDPGIGHYTLIGQSLSGLHQIEIDCFDPETAEQFIEAYS